jgi:hypothetical protein
MTPARSTMSNQDAPIDARQFYLRQLLSAPGSHSAHGGLSPLPVNPKLRAYAVGLISRTA